jgi:hypothetical protein
MKARDFDKEALATVSYANAWACDILSVSLFV